MKTPPAWLRNIVCALLVAFCAWTYVRTNIIRPLPSIPRLSDSSAYFQAGTEILHGRSPYSDPALFYPPLLPFLMAPFALLDYVTARWTWFVLSHLFLLGGAALLWRAMGRGRVALCCIACVWAFGGAANETLRQGQLSALLVLVLVTAYTQRGRLQGLAAGLGFALKYFPGIVALPLLLARRWRAFAAATWVGVAGVALPWLAIWGFFSGAKAPVSATYWMGTPSMFSWSVPSLVLRLLTPITRGAPFPPDWEFGNVAATLHLGARLEWISVAAAVSVIALGVLALALVSAGVSGGRLSDDQIPFAMAGLVSLSLAAAPVCWTHYQLMQYPGVAMLLIVAIRRGYWLLAAATAICFALVYQLPELFLANYSRLHNGWTTDSPPTIYFWTSIPPLAELGIFALAVEMVRRLQTKALAAQSPAGRPDSRTP